MSHNNLTWMSKARKSNNSLSCITGSDGRAVEEWSTVSANLSVDVWRPQYYGTLVKIGV